MKAVILTDVRRRWKLFRRRRFVLQLPESWAELSITRRHRWWRWVATLDAAEAKNRIIRDLVPARWLRKMASIEAGAISAALDWASLQQDADVVPIPDFWWGDEHYIFPQPKGPNVSGVEFALCDDYLKAFMQGDTDALLHLSACIWREEGPDHSENLIRGDARIPLHNKMEVEARAKRLQDAPAEIHVQAFTWFVGFKKLVHRVYGPWIFEEQEEEEEEETDTPAPAPKPTGGPNFGWWGIFIDVAEGGAYGTKNQVYQESIHDICILLVKKRADANQIPESKQTSPSEEEDNDD